MEETLSDMQNGTTLRNAVPQGLIHDPIVPDEDPMEIIASVQAEITATRAWKTVEGSRYEDPLCSPRLHTQTGEDDRYVGILWSGD